MYIDTKNLPPCAVPSTLFLSDLTKEARMNKITVLSNKVSNLVGLVFECRSFILDAKKLAKNVDEEYYINDLIERIDNAIFVKKRRILKCNQITQFHFLYCYGYTFYLKF